VRCFGLWKKAILQNPVASRSTAAFGPRGSREDTAHIDGCHPEKTHCPRHNHLVPPLLWSFVKTHFFVLHLNTAPPEALSPLRKARLISPQTSLPSPFLRCHVSAPLCGFIGYGRTTKWAKAGRPRRMLSTSITWTCARRRASTPVFQPPTLASWSSGLSQTSSTTGNFSSPSCPTTSYWFLIWCWNSPFSHHWLIGLRVSVKEGSTRRDETALHSSQENRSGEKERGAAAPADACRSTGAVQLLPCFQP